MDMNKLLKLNALIAAEMVVDVINPNLDGKAVLVLAINLSIFTQPEIIRLRLTATQSQ